MVKTQAERCQMVACERSISEGANQLVITKAKLKWIDSSKGDDVRKDLMEECYWMLNYSVEQSLWKSGK